MMLNGKGALVTGGSRGIGKGIVMALASAGARVVFTYHYNEDKARRICDEVRNMGGQAWTVPLSLDSRSSVENLFKEARTIIESVDILVNNAAIAQEKPFELLTDDDWNNMMSINLGGPFRCCQIAIPAMIKNGWGRIINISSIGGQWGGFNQVHYAAAKAGLINLTRSLAKLYSGKGITANAIAPGLVATDMTAAELKSDAGMQKIKSIPAKRLGSPDEIGATVVFLSSDLAAYITGQTLNLNGGLYFG